MEKTGLRDTALKEIDKVNWYPATGKNRIYSMIEGRPDWVLSRQRAWGVPLTIFVDKKTGAPLRDDAVNSRIVAAVKEQGADAWFNTDPQVFLGSDYAAEDYEQVSDILDVWFDSGVTHAFVMISADSAAFEPKVPKFLAHRGSVAMSLIGCSAVVKPIARYSAAAILPKASSMLASRPAAKPSCDGHLETPPKVNEAIPPPLGTS